MFNKILKTYGLIVATGSIAFCAEEDSNPSYMSSAEKKHLPMPLTPPPPTLRIISTGQMAEPIERPMPLTPPPPTLGKVEANDAAEEAGHVKLTLKSSYKRGAIKDVFPEAFPSSLPLKNPASQSKELQDQK